MTKQDILENLEAFAMQRPGLMFADYGDASLYRRDYWEHCGQPLTDFRNMFSAILGRDSLTADDLRQAIRETNRLDMLDDGRFDYTPGQMGATEYRHAACNVLARALWNYWREDVPENKPPRNYIYRNAVRQFGRGIANRYFD